VGPVPPRRWLKQARPDNCSQTVIAMLTGRSVSAISRSAGHTGALGVSQALRLLSALGLPLARPIAGRHAAEFWPVYRQRSGGRRLRGLAFRVSRPGEE